MRSLLVVGAVTATVAAAGIAAQVSASGTASATPPVSAAAFSATPPVSAAAFESTGGHATVGKVTGVIPARGARVKAAATATTATAASCTEPNCDMSYHGGPVQHSPHVYVMFWGPAWTTDSTQEAAEQYLISFYKGLGQTSKDGWSTITSQYGDKSGHPAFGGSLLAGYHQDTSTPPSQVSATDLGNEAAKAVSVFNISDTKDAQVVIASQSGTCFAPIDGAIFGGNCGQLQSSGYCGFHSYDVDGSNSSIFLPWVNLPYQPDAQTGCGENFINLGAAGTSDGFSITGGHESVETITDPTAAAWYDASDTIDGGGEVGDKCVWGGQPFGVSDPAGDVALTTGSFAMQSLWSNAVGKCVMNGSLPLSVTTPATQKSILGHGVSLQIQAAVGGSTPLSYAASGLPAGLSINRSTGVISGTPGVTAGTFAPKVTASYYAGSKTVSFSWQVSSVAGPVKGYASKCVDDTSGRTTSGNKIQIWTCNGGTSQRITFTANRQLQVVGRCITGGNTAFLEPCSTATNETWTRLSNGEYVLKLNGRCLTEPSTTNGRQLTLAACNNTANQHWSLP